MQTIVIALLLSAVLAALLGWWLARELDAMRKQLPPKFAPVMRRYQHVGTKPQYTPDGQSGFALLMVGRGGCGSKTSAATVTALEVAAHGGTTYCDGCQEWHTLNEFVWEGTKDILKLEDFRG